MVTIDDIKVSPEVRKMLCEYEQRVILGEQKSTLVTPTLMGCDNKIAKAIKIYQSFQPEDGYYVAFSGGKDSQCVYHLALLAGVKFDAHYSVTSVDPPELVRFIKQKYPEVSCDIPRNSKGETVTMWKLIAAHTIPPTRKARYCCAELKETNGKGRVTVTGVRWAESVRRKNLHGVVDVQTKSQKIINGQLQNNPAASLNKRGGLILNDDNDESRRMVEQCYRTRKTLVNPILDWTDEDVWEFLNEFLQVEHCCLYDPPYNKKRLGCIGCPMSGREGIERDFAEYPKYKEMYIRAFQKMIDNHPGQIRILEEASVDVEERERESDGVLSAEHESLKNPMFEFYMRCPGGRKSE